MKYSKSTLLGIASLLVCAAMVAGGCAPQDASTPTPTAQATDTSEAAPTPEPTDRSAAPPTIQPVDTPAPVPTPDAPEATPISQAGDTPEADPTPEPTQTASVCMGLDPTNTPDPNRPEGILGRTSEFWNVSSFEEAECITDYRIAVPTNLPDGFIRAENIIVHKSGTSHFEDRFVEHWWNIPGDPPYGFMLSQRSWRFGRLSD